MGHSHAHPTPVTAIAVDASTLEVTRLGTALGFYCGVLGGQIDSMDGDSARIRFGESMLALREGSPGDVAGSIRATVADVESAARALEAAGFAGADLVDPDGRPVELVAPDG